jgi:hypothetical protein
VIAVKVFVEHFWRSRIFTSRKEKFNRNFHRIMLVAQSQNWGPAMRAVTLLVTLANWPPSYNRTACARNVES